MATPGNIPRVMPYLIIIIQVAKVMVFEKLVSPLIPKAVYLQVTVL